MFLLDLMLFGFNFLVAALRELALLLEPPLRVGMGGWFCSSWVGGLLSVGGLLAWVFVGLVGFNFGF